MDRILLDVTRLLYRRAMGTLATGIDRVGLEYVRHFGPGARAVLSLGPFSAVLPEKDSAAIFAGLLSREGNLRALALRAVVKAFLWRWLAGDVRGATLFNTGHYGLENPRYAWSLRRRGARLAVFVHDLIPLRHPEHCRPDERRKHAVRMTTAVRNAAAIVANSRHTLEDLNAFCREEKLRMPHAAVAPLAPALAAAGTGAPFLPGPYFVFLATIEPRKNHAMILEVWKRLAASLGESAPKLVLIGQRGWNAGTILAAIERSPELAHLVMEKPHCGDAELAGWLSHARALLLPSFAEGYGMPVTEALALGVPAIASDLAVFRETVGAIPEYANPKDTARWEALVLDYLQPESGLRRAQLARLRAFRPATWAQHFAHVEALLWPGRNRGKSRAAKRHDEKVLEEA